MMEWLDIESILNQYKIILEPLPYRGCIDYDKKEIKINPLFNQEETLAHEVLHHYFLENNVRASENYIKEKQNIVVNRYADTIKEYIENYGMKAQTSSLHRFI